MRAFPTLVLVAMLAGGVAAPVSATSTSVLADGTDRQMSAAPQSFRWVPYGGVPNGAQCSVSGNDQGAAVVNVAESENGPTSLWLARATSAQQLMLPAGVPTGATTWMPKISTTGVVAALIGTYAPAPMPAPRPSGVQATGSSGAQTDMMARVQDDSLAARWDAQGNATLSPPLPQPPEGITWVNWSVEGVTARGDVVAFVRSWDEANQRWGFTIMVWKAEGNWQEAYSGLDEDWSTRATSVLSNGTIVVGREPWRGEQGSTVLRPRPDGTGWIEEWKTSVIDAVSADRQWWAGRRYTPGSPPEGNPTENSVVNFGYAKGLSSPLISVLNNSTWWIAPYASAINNQGTMVMWDGQYMWRNGHRVTSIEPNIQRLPAGGRVHPFSLRDIDTAGRMATSIDLPGGKCSAGLLAPQW